MTRRDLLTFFLLAAAFALFAFCAVEAFLS